MQKIKYALHPEVKPENWCHETVSLPVRRPETVMLPMFWQRYEGSKRHQDQNDDNAQAPARVSNAPLALPDRMGKLSYLFLEDADVSFGPVVYGEFMSEWAYTLLRFSDKWFLLAEGGPRDQVLSRNLDRLTEKQAAVWLKVQGYTVPEELEPFAGNLLDDPPCWPCDQPVNFAKAEGYGLFRRLEPNHDSPFHAGLFRLVNCWFLIQEVQVQIWDPYCAPFTTHFFPLSARQAFAWFEHHHSYFELPSEFFPFAREKDIRNSLKRERATLEDTDRRARAIGQEDSDFPTRSARKWAAKLGCALGMVTDLPYWKETKHLRVRGKAPKAVTLSSRVESTMGKEDEVLQMLIREQEADFEPSPLDNTQKWVITRKKV
jgi:hypothetical protein